MKAGEYAQVCSALQLNKAILLLIDIRDDLNAVCKTSDMKLAEIKGLRIDILITHRHAIPMIMKA